MSRPPPPTMQNQRLRVARSQAWPAPGSKPDVPKDPAPYLEAWKRNQAAINAAADETVAKIPKPWPWWLAPWAHLAASIARRLPWGKR